MSIYGINNSNVNRLPTQAPVRDNRTPGQKPASSGVPVATVPAQTLKQTQAAGAATQSVPAEPPPGTDPALWSILSGEERAFFAKAGNMGPLTYGRAFSEMKAAQLPVARGGRLDVKA